MGDGTLYSVERSGYTAMIRGAKRASDECDRRICKRCHKRLGGSVESLGSNGDVASILVMKKHEDGRPFDRERADLCVCEKPRYRETYSDELPPLVEAMKG